MTTASPALLRPRPDPLAPEAIVRIWPLVSGRTVLIGACLLVIAMGWDRATWLAVGASGRPALEHLEKYARVQTLPGAFGSAGTSFGEALAGTAYAVVYHFGRIWVWVVAAVVTIFAAWITPDTARVRHALRTGVLLFLTPAIGGLGAEVVKLVSRRQRPEVSDGFYSFRPPSGSPFSPGFYDLGNLGLASSHASLAVAAALAAGLVFPRLRWVLILLAIATCLSRVLVGAHYLSDVVAGAMIGALAFRLVYRWDARNNGGRAYQPLSPAGVAP